MGKLLSIPVVQDVTEIRKLREVYDLIEVHARNLKILDANTKEYGPVLISIVMSKLPSDIRLVISRTMSLNDKWDVDKLLEILRREVEYRENHSLILFITCLLKHNVARSEV